MTTQKSAIRECKDQLFLDRADGKYLSHVTSNLSFHRPTIGFHDDSIWRAVVRRLALDYRQVLPLFHDLLTIIFGPRRTVSTVLASNIEALDEQIYIAEWMNIPQRGILVLDEGLPSEETIEYLFRDPKSGLTDLETVALNAHTAITNAVGYSVSDLIPTATSIILEDTSLFPTPTGGAKYTMIVGQGTDDEEVVLLTANNIALNTLTIDPPGLINNHLGPQTTPTVAKVLEIQAGGSVLKLSSTRNFTAEGLIRIQQDVLIGTPTATLRYTDNDIDNGILTLAAPVPAGYVIPPGGTITVTLMEPGVSVRMAQVQVKGVGWEVYQTQPWLVQIYLPISINRNRLVDASFLHSNVISPVPSLLSTQGATAGSTVLWAVETDLNVRNFPRSGVIVINPGGGTEEYVGYTIPDYDQTELNTTTNTIYGIGGSFTGIAPAMTFNNAFANFSSYDIGRTISISGSITPGNDGVFVITGVPLPTQVQYTNLTGFAELYFGTWGITGGIGIPIGTTEIFVNDARVIKEGESLISGKQIGLSWNNAARFEWLTYTEIDLVANRIVLSSPTTLLHLGGDKVGSPNVGAAFYLSRPLTNAHAPAEPVALVQIAWFGTDIEDGRLAFDYGIGGSFTGVAPAMTFNNSFANFTSYDIGRNISISGSTTPGNDGVFIITGVPSSTQVQYTNLTGFAELYFGSWLLTGVSKRFPGHYIYDHTQYYPRRIQTILTENIAGPTKLAVTQNIGRCGLEVQNAALFDTTGSFDIRISKGGNEETLDVTTVVTKVSFGAFGVVTSAGTLGQFQLAVVGMPAWLGNDIGIRLLVNQGGLTEEVVILKRVVLPTLITLEDPLSYNHGPGEPIKLMSDVILLSENLANDHFGYVPFPNRRMVYPNSIMKDSKISIVEEIRTRIDVSSAASMPSSGDSVLINFGSGLISAESRNIVDTGFGAVGLLLEDTSSFPTSGYPYLVEVGVDCDSFEVLSVTSNIANALTFSTLTYFNHRKGEWVRYRTGSVERLTYTSTTTVGGTERLLFPSGVRFNDSHLKGETISLDNKISIPSKYGNDYPLNLPSSWEDRLKYLFDHGRAAGVQIVIIDSK